MAALLLDSQLDLEGVLLRRDNFGFDGSGSNSDETNDNDGYRDNKGGVALLVPPTSPPPDLEREKLSVSMMKAFMAFTST